MLTSEGGIMTDDEIQLELRRLWAAIALLANSIGDTVLSDSDLKHCQEQLLSSEDAPPRSDYN